MQGIVTTVSARLGGKHEAPSQYGEQMALKYSDILVSFYIFVNIVFRNEAGGSLLLKSKM